MQMVIELVTGLFQDPKATMYRAREDDCRAATLGLAAASICLHILLMKLAGAPLAVAVLAAMVAFLQTVLPIWFGGSITGGTGSLMDITQLCGLVYLPLAVVSAVCGGLHLGAVSWAINWVVMYWLIMIGHNFSTFDDLKLAYAAAIVMSLVVGAMGQGLIGAMVHASLS